MGRIKWTKSKIIEEAQKYNTRTEFSKNSGGAYYAAQRRGLLNEVCQHMHKVGNLYNRCIYVIVFEDNYTYIGLTYYWERRYNRHLKEGPVYKHSKISKIIKAEPITDYIDVKEAQKLEQYYMDQYSNKGYILLNKAKGGGIGGDTIIWDLDKCKEEALKYTNRNDFRINSGSAYYSARRNKWLNSICSHMKSQLGISQIKWTYEMCKEEALKYNNRKDFRTNSINAYQSAIRNKWLDIICIHMINTTKRKTKWNLDKCKDVALEYNTRSEFRKHRNDAYAWARRNNVLDEVCSHMKRKEGSGLHMRKCTKVES